MLQALNLYHDHAPTPEEEAAVNQLYQAASRQLTKFTSAHESALDLDTAARLAVDGKWTRGLLLQAMVIDQLGYLQLDCAAGIEAVVDKLRCSFQVFVRTGYHHSLRCCHVDRSPDAYVQMWRHMGPAPGWNWNEPPNAEDSKRRSTIFLNSGASQSAAYMDPPLSAQTNTEDIDFSHQALSTWMHEPHNGQKFSTTKPSLAGQASRLVSMHDLHPMGSHASSMDARLQHALLYRDDVDSAVSVAKRHQKVMQADSCDASAVSNLHMQGPTNGDLDDLSRLQAVYDKPINEAAKALGVGVTVLKKQCRKYGIGRWPYRKLASLDKLMESVVRVLSEDPSDGPTQEALLALQQQRMSIFVDPSQDLNEWSKKLRQANFKQQYKFRQKEEDLGKD